MKIGKYDLYSVETTEFGLDGAMFGIIPKPVWEKKVSADELNRVNMVTRSLLLVSDEKKILIDTGNGTKWEEKYKQFTISIQISITLKNLLGSMALVQNKSLMLYAHICILIISVAIQK